MTLAGCMCLQFVLSACDMPQLPAPPLPVPLDRTITIGVPDGTNAFSSYQTHPYVGYSKDSGSWKVLLEMSHADSDNLSRGFLGTLTEVRQVRVFAADSAAATLEFNAQVTRVKGLLGEPTTCATYGKAQSIELRWEWSTAGRYFVVIHSQAPNDHVVAVQWAGQPPDASQRTAEQCTLPTGHQKPIA
jgi:hypothetical protein